jgi:hypothetical protein
MATLMRLLVCLVSLTDHNFQKVQLDPADLEEAYGGLFVIARIADKGEYDAA